MPATDRFVVSVGNSDRLVQSVGIDGADVRDVRVTLVSPVAPGDPVAVTYTCPDDESNMDPCDGNNPLRDVSGNPVPNFDDPEQHSHVK